MEVAAPGAALRVAVHKRFRFLEQPERLDGRGARIYLRPPKPEDRREFIALRKASRKFHAPFELRASDGKPMTLARLFRMFLDQGPGTSRERWLICSKLDDAILGGITIGAIRGEPFQGAVLGYWIGAAFARQGFMGEALELAIRRAFGGLKLRRLEADVLPENLASKRLLRRSGFTKEGLAREFAHVGGAWRDHERWALLARDLRKSQRPQSRK